MGTKEKEIWETYPQLLHYTTLEKCISIIEKKELWAFDYKTMNDQSEFDDTMKFVKDHYSAQYELIEPAFNEHIKNRFLFSMSAFPDDPRDKYNGILSLWRFYAGKGVAIIFDSKKLFDSFEKIDKSKIRTITFDKVSYQNYPGYIETLNKYVNIIVQELEKIKGNRNLDAQDLLINTLKVAFLFKNRHFHAEKEIRIGAVSTYQDNEYGHVDKPHFPSARFIKLPFNNNSIKGIIVGPGLSQKSIEYDLKQQLKNLKLPIQVYCSEIPHI